MTSPLGYDGIFDQFTAEEAEDIIITTAQQHPEASNYNFNFIPFSKIVELARAAREINGHFSDNYKSMPKYGDDAVLLSIAFKEKNAHPTPNQKSSK